MIPQFPQPSPIASIIWENFGKGENRRLNTFNKKEINLQEEMNNKKVIEEYVEDKSSVHYSNSLKDSAGFDSQRKQTPAKNQEFQNINAPIPHFGHQVSVQDIENHTIGSY